MATVLTANAMLAALAKWGITPKFYKSDWASHNRNAVQGWGPLYGFVVHNFGSDVSDTNSLAYLYNGDTSRGMPGPLSQFAITDDGQVWVIGWGTANHTGSIDPRLLSLVQNDKAPLDSDFKPNTSFSNKTGTHSINDNFVGVEMTYGKAPTAAQRKSVALLGAALMDALGSGYTGGSVVGHRETDTGRSDPVGIPMWQLRREINALLKAGPGAGSRAPEPTPAPKPAVKEGFLMALNDKQQQEIYDILTGRIPQRPSVVDATKPAKVLDSNDGNYIVNILSGIAQKVGAPVDPTAVAQALAPVVRDAVKAAGQPDAVADAVVAKLGQHLSA